MSLQESEANEEKAEAGAAGLFSPLVIRDVFFRNRIVVAPVCTYSSEGGFANDWHLVNLGSRAAGGAALVGEKRLAVGRQGGRHRERPEHRRQGQGGKLSLEGLEHG